MRRCRWARSDDARSTMQRFGHAAIICARDTRRMLFCEANYSMPTTFTRHFASTLAAFLDFARAAIIFMHARRRSPTRLFSPRDAGHNFTIRLLRVSYIL